MSFRGLVPCFLVLTLSASLGRAEPDLAALKAAAKRGDPGAQYAIGMLLATGKGVAKDVAKGLRWLERAGEGGHAKACFRAGAIYAKGAPGVEKELLHAMTWLHRAERLGLAAGAARQEKLAAGFSKAECYELGCIYRDGSGTPRDPREAIEWFRRAAAGGAVEAWAPLGLLILEAEVDQAKLSEGIAALERAAAAGDAPAALGLARATLEGIGCEKRAAGAVDWYRKAAEAGSSEAAFELGMLLKRGIDGVPPDPAQGLAWLTRSAEGGSADAALEVGLSHLRGEGTATDAGAATPWFARAAEAGLAEAQFRMGLAWAGGQGGPVDLGHARECMEKASAQGHEPATEWLAQGGSPAGPRPPVGGSAISGLFVAGTPTLVVFGQPG